MIRGIWQFEVPHEKQAEYLEATEKLIKPYWESKACLSYEVYQDREDSLHFVKMQVYKDLADMESDGRLLETDPLAMEVVRTFRSFAENVTSRICELKSI